MNWKTEVPETDADNGTEPGPCRIDGDALIIDCTGCRYVPVPGSRECMGCMVSGMCEAGSAARIILRTGKDTEVSGRSGSALREAASLRRWALPTRKPRGRCAKCPASRYSLVNTAWSTFPEPAVRKALDVLDGFEAERPDCTECVRNSRRALEQMGRRLNDLRDRMASE